MQRDQEWWDRWFLGLAQYYSTASKDPSTQTGAVIVQGKNTLVSCGYNGFPRYLTDDDRLNDRAKKYERVVHCEVNAILTAHQRLYGCTLYNWPGMSCAQCAPIVIQAGIVRIVSPVDHDLDRPLRHQCHLAIEMFQEAAISLVYYDLQEVSRLKPGAIIDRRTIQHAQEDQQETEGRTEVPESHNDQGLQRNDPLQEAPGSTFSGLYDYWEGLRQKSSCGGC